MYAIIEDSGRQYKVQQGETVYVDIRDLAEGQEKLEFDKVLFLRSDGEVKIGQPYLEGAKVIGKVADKAMGPKVYTMHFRRRKNSRRRVGHRQKYLEIEITDIVSA